MESIALYNVLQKELYQFDVEIPLKCRQNKDVKKYSYLENILLFLAGRLSRQCSVLMDSQSLQFYADNLHYNLATFIYRHYYPQTNRKSER